MNKKLVALGVAAVIAAPAAALAEVSVGARLQVELTSYDDGDTNDGLYQGDVSEGSNYSALWFEGTEELGNGWTAFGKINFNLDASDDTDGIGRRDAFLGMKNEVFALSGGRINSAYKKASVQYDPFLATSLQARTNGGMSSGGFGHTNYLEDIIEAAVKFGAISAILQYSFDDNEVTFGGDTTNQIDDLTPLRSKDGSYSAMLSWGPGPFELFGALSHAEIDENTIPVGSTLDDKADNWKLGGKWETGPFMVAAQYEEAELGTLNGRVNTDDPAKIFLVTGSWDFGNWTAAGWVSQYDQDNYGDGINYALGGMYNFSKRTRLHAGYRKMDIDLDGGGTDEEDVWTLGMRFVL